jgi:hypothetical protein
LVFASVFDHDSEPSIINSFPPVLIIIYAEHTLSHFAPFRTVLKGLFFRMPLELPMDQDSPASQQLDLELFLWAIDHFDLCNLEATIPRDVFRSSLLHELIGDYFPSLHWFEISLSLVG